MGAVPGSGGGGDGRFAPGGAGRFAVCRCHRPARDDGPRGEGTCGRGAAVWLARGNRPFDAPAFLRGQGLVPEESRGAVRVAGEGPGAVSGAHQGDETVPGRRPGGFLQRRVHAAALQPGQTSSGRAYDHPLRGQRRGCASAGDQEFAPLFRRHPDELERGHRPDRVRAGRGLLRAAPGPGNAAPGGGRRPVHDRREAGLPPGQARCLRLPADGAHANGQSLLGQLLPALQGIRHQPCPVPFLVPAGGRFRGRGRARDLPPAGAPVLGNAGRGGTPRVPAERGLEHRPYLWTSPLFRDVLPGERALG